MTIREFWRSTFTLPRLALMGAVLASVVNLASYAGATITSMLPPFMYLHLVVMALGLTLFVRVAVHHWLAALAPKLRLQTSRPPAALVWTTGGVFAYMLAVGSGLFMVYGEGSAQVRDGREVWVVGRSVVRAMEPGSVALFDARMLRMFSAAWLFFCLMIALAGHRIEERIRGYRHQPRPATSDDVDQNGAGI